MIIIFCKSITNIKACQKGKNGLKNDFKKGSYDDSLLYLHHMLCSGDGIASRSPVQHQEVSMSTSDSLHLPEC